MASHGLTGNCRNIPCAELSPSCGLNGWTTMFEWFLLLKTVVVRSVATINIEMAINTTLVDPMVSVSILESFWMVPVTSWHGSYESFTSFTSTVAGIPSWWNLRLQMMVWSSGRWEKNCKSRTCHDIPATFPRLVSPRQAAAKSSSRATRRHLAGQWTWGWRMLMANKWLRVGENLR